MAGVETTNLGPLTTTFIPPPECTSGILYRYYGQTDYAYQPYGLTISCSSLFSDAYATTVYASGCYPLTASVDLEYPPATTRYSPGAICPSGFSLDCTLTSYDHPNVVFPGETVGVCCPRRYSCGSDPRFCTWTATAGQLISGWAASRVPSTSCRSSYTTVTVLESAREFPDDPFLLVRKATDPPFAETPSHQLKGDTRKMTQIGLGVGLGVGIFVFLAVVTVLVLYMHSREKKKKNAALNQSRNYSQGSHAVDTQQKYPVLVALSEAPATHVYHTQQTPVEDPTYRYQARECLVEVPSPEDSLQRGPYEVASPTDPIRGGSVEAP